MIWWHKSVEKKKTVYKLILLEVVYNTEGHMQERSQ